MIQRRTPDPTPGEEHRLRALLRLAADATRAGNAPAAVTAVRSRFRRRRLARLTGAGVAAAGVAAASVLIATAGGSGPTPAVHQIGPYRLTGALVSFDGCDTYLRYVRNRAEKAVGSYALSGGPYYKGLINDQVLHLPSAGPAPVPTGAFGGAGVARPAVPVPSSAPGFSSTNNQVAGVDEPDTVKTDGTRVVTLAGPTLRVLDTSAHVLGRLRLDGDTGGGLLLAGDRALVLSSDGSTPTYGFGGLVRYPISQPSTTARVAVIDLSRPDQPRLLRTFLFDGTAVAARLVDGQVRLVLRSDGPRLNFESPSDSVTPHAAKRANRQLVATSTLDDWLPAWQTQAPDGSTSARHHISSCDAVARPRHASGLSTVSVLSLDPNADAPGPATSVVAAGDTVYASAGHVYVAGATTRQLPKSHRTTPRDVKYGAYRPDLIQTRIYDFATSGGQPRFVAAGSVPGTLLSSYAMDEDAAGRLRVASTAQDSRGRTDSRVSVLAVSGKTLTTLGSLDGLGHGQDLRAVRFVGDLAYVVTFRTFDPLYVVDLRDAANPRVIGQLEQPGYNEFLYPLSSDRLLGVGVRVSHNEPAQLLISTYDVSDPAHPQRIDEHVLAKGSAAAESRFDPHAFLSWPDARLIVAAVPHGGGASAYRVGSDGTLTAVRTLSHNRLNPDRTLVLGKDLWAVTVSGVITSPLPDLANSSWNPY
jgi:hypothetical protein